MKLKNIKFKYYRMKVSDSYDSYDSNLDNKALP